MPEEITDPVEGVLNLFTSQYKTQSKVIADMREENRPPAEIDVELSYMGHLQRRIYSICQENGLDFTAVITNASLSHD